MANTRKSQTTFFSISYLMLIIIPLSINLNLSKAEYIADLKATTTATNTSTGGSGLYKLEFVDDLSEFSAWESASTHRFLSNSIPRIDIGKIVTNKNQAACNGKKYSSCEVGATGKGARPCDDYIRCKKSSS